MDCSSSSGRSFWLSLSLPLSGALLFAAGYSWLFLAIALVLIPILDACIGRGAPLSAAEIERSSERQIPCWFAACWAVALAIAAREATTADPVEFIGLVISCGVLSATAMAHLHELTHRSGRLWRGFSDIAFTVAGYPHYRLAHELHHAHLGDPSFGSTASVGTSSWSHAGRSYLSALRASLNPNSYQNRSVPRRLFANISIALLLVLFPLTLHAWWLSLFVLGYATISVFIVETVGYMQHYGFDHQSQHDAIHSWDVDFWLSNCLLVNNGYHGAHHENGRSPYSQLRPTRAALPGGYFHMLWLSLLPPAWFSVMDRRVDVLNKRRRRQLVALRKQSGRDRGEII
jgi:alkane 1-monooxygenase